jgi:hypothetical protein
LASNAWQHGARVQAFTTQIFAETHTTAGGQSQAPKGEIPS